MSDVAASQRFLQDRGPVGRAAGRIARHWRWGRTEGFDRVIEEDQANPVDRLRLALRRARWRRSNPVVAGSARAVFLVGVQRSGTNMVVRGLERSPEFEVHNENSRQAFDRYLLRDVATIRSIIEQSRQRFVLFKPLCDSHRIGDVVDELATSTPARIVWAYREVDGRVRSAVSKFGDINRQVLAGIAAGGTSDRWQSGGLTDERLGELAAFDWDRLSAYDGAALFWYVRNQLFFDSGLDRRPDATLVSYEAVLEEPVGEVEALCDFLAFGFTPQLIAHVEDRHVGAVQPVDLDPQVRELCDGLAVRLEAHRMGSAVAR